MKIGRNTFGPLVVPDTLFAACAALLVLGSGCSLEPRSTGQTAAAAPGPDEIIEDFRMNETASGARSWTMHARRAFVYNADSRLDVHGVDVDFFDESGKKYSHLTADSGSVNQSTNDMRADGHVDIRTTSGVHVEAPGIRFWNAAQKITSGALVKVTDAKGSVLTGVGFESDVKVEHYKVGKVDATLRQGGTDRLSIP